ncbi:unnamed protein product, partial [Ostreobium quekettii]|eukprot:evm.model.scf_163.2 EVM.evm.TU.scf_163.2   scf_163:104155-107759(+)
MTPFTLTIANAIVVFGDAKSGKLTNNYDHGGWQPIPEGSFPTLVSIRGRGREHICFGTVIREYYILSSAECVEIVGPNPIVIIGLHGRDDDRSQPGVEERRAERAYVHPHWNGNFDEGYDIALFKLPRPVGGQFPSIGGPSTKISNRVLYGFGLNGVVQVAEFEAIEEGPCPRLSTMGNNSFCIHSKGANMYAGCSGGPVIVIEGKKDANIFEVKQTDIAVVGVVSYANHSSLSDSGVGCTPTEKTVQWINSITSPK